MRGGPSTPCLMCGQLDTDDLHTCWICPSLEAAEEEDIKDTQYHVQAAKEGSVEFPCLWLRGCLPLGMVEVKTPVVENEHFEYFGTAGPKVLAGRQAVDRRQRRRVWQGPSNPELWMW